MAYPVYNKEDLHFAEQDGDTDLQEFSAFIESLIEHDLFNHGAEKGVANYISEYGTKGLSPDQRKVLDIIVDRHQNQSCNRCNQEIAWSEVVGAYYNGGYCSYCDYQMTKDD